MGAEQLLGTLAGSGDGKGDGKGLVGGLLGGAGAIYGIIEGNRQLREGEKLNKRADAAMPAQEDPEMRGFLTDLDRKRKTFMTGSAFSSARREMGQLQSGTLQGAKNFARTPGEFRRIAGGASRVAGTQYNNILGAGLENAKFYTQMYGGLLGNISQRKLDLSLLRSARLAGRAAALEQSGYQNKAAAIMGLMSMGGSLLGGREEKDTPAVTPAVS